MTSTLVVQNPYDGAALQGRSGFRRGPMEKLPIRERTNAWVLPSTERVTFRPPWAPVLTDVGSTNATDQARGLLHPKHLAILSPTAGATRSVEGYETQPLFLTYSTGLYYTLPGSTGAGSPWYGTVIYANNVARYANALAYYGGELSPPFHGAANGPLTGGTLARTVTAGTGAAWTLGSTQNTQYVYKIESPSVVAGFPPINVAYTKSPSTFPQARDLAYIQGRLVVLASNDGAWTLYPSAAGGVWTGAPSPFAYARGAGLNADPMGDAHACVRYREKYLAVATASSVTVFSVDNERFAGGGSLFAREGGQGTVGVGTEAWGGLLEAGKEVWILGRHGLASMGSALERDESVIAPLAPEDNQTARDFYLRAISAASGSNPGGVLHNIYVEEWQSAFFFCPLIQETLVVQKAAGRWITSLWSGWTPWAVRLLVNRTGPEVGSPLVSTPTINYSFDMADDPLEPQPSGVTSSYPEGTLVRVSGNGAYQILQLESDIDGILTPISTEVNGIWYHQSTTWSVGTHTLRARHQGPAGTWGAWSAPFELTITSVAPPLSGIFAVPGTEGYALDLTDPSKVTLIGSGPTIDQVAFYMSADTPSGAGTGQTFAALTDSGSRPSFVASGARGYASFAGSERFKVWWRGLEFASPVSGAFAEGSHYIGYAARPTSFDTAGYTVIAGSSFGGGPDYNNQTRLVTDGASGFRVGFLRPAQTTAYYYNTGAGSRMFGTDLIVSGNFPGGVSGVNLTPVMRVNGTVDAPTLTPTFNNAGWRITVANGSANDTIGGTSYDGSTDFIGRLYRFVRINRELSPTELAEVEAWLSDGLPANW